MLLSIKESLKSLVGEVVDFAKHDFNKKAYIFTAFFIFITLIVNYVFGLNSKILSKAYITGDSWWTSPLFYLIVYFATAIPTLYFRREYATLRNPQFYLKSAFFTTLYGFSVGFYEYSNISFNGLLASELWYIKMILSQLKCAVFFFIPLAIMKLTVDKHVNGIYGIARKPKHLDAYLVLFFIMIPFLVLTSFTSDFLQAYPQFRPWYYEGIFGMSTWEYTLLFEITYAFDFIMTELIFRGTLVIGMMAIMGRSAVLPMVAFYCAIHFGKPLVEAVSSIFGGYILGALAYQTRHIWGGVMVHICIAITMEVMGFVHYYLIKN